ncbi:MAG: hypothetical protein JOZ82_04275, partial [Marmoricola sp.]|nr:hypothetical protein [Marmoricola sp.]
WVLLLVGIVALPLPGPGAMIIFLAMIVLATQYEWAEQRLEGIRDWALRGAADSVRTWPRILVSIVGVAWLIGFGVLWWKHPDAPTWWPLEDRWWLVGGWGTGATLIFSGVVALALLVYSFVTLRERGEAPTAHGSHHQDGADDSASR